MRNSLFFILIFFLFFSFVSTQSDACFSVIAGKSATEDGSVLLGHNEDNGMDDVSGINEMVRTINSAEEYTLLSHAGIISKKTFANRFLAAKTLHLPIPYCVLNDKGVAITSNLCASREDKPEIVDGGIGEPVLRRLVAQHAKTAREVVEMTGSLVERFGYTSVGRTMLICDSNEGWMLGLVKGKHWVAARVPDDEVAFLSNTYPIHEIDLTDTANFRGSPGLINYAIKRGWYDQKDGAFDFAKAYAVPEVRLHPENLNRLWSAMSKISREIIPLAETQNLPFSIKPKSKLSAGTMFSILRDHYEQTPLWQLDLKHDLSPHAGPYTICNHNTNYSSVYQLRSNIPVEIGAVWWLSMLAPCSSPFIPIYLDTAGISPDLGFVRNRNNADIGFGPAFKLFHSVRNQAHHNFEQRGKPLQKQWCQMEDATLEMQKIIEAEAKEKWYKNQLLSRQMLSLFSRGALLRAMEIAESFLEKETKTN